MSQSSASFRQIESLKLRVSDGGSSSLDLSLMREAGLNEITISDLTFLADPDSVRVAGTTDNHPARINDLTIDLVPNNQSSVSDFSDSESDLEDVDEDEEPATLKTANEALEKVVTKMNEVEERLASARQEMSLVEQYASTVASNTASMIVPDPKTMKDTLDLYNKQRTALFDATTTFNDVLAELEKERVKKRKAHDKEKRAHSKATRAKAEERKKKKADKEERQREKNEKKPEKFRSVHRVRITIELPSSDLTRTAQGSDTDETEVFREATLTLTYTTTSASWTPHYDLRLDTTNPSLSSLTYRAHFTNRTYETWSQAAITLSTSQASFGGLKEKIPQMEGWRVTLTKKSHIHACNGENGLYSLAELKAKKEAEQKEYGIDVGRERERERIHRCRFQSRNSPPEMAQPPGFMPSVVPGQPQPPGFIPSAPVRQSASRFIGSASSRSSAEEKRKNEDSSDEDMGFGLFDNDTLVPGAQAIQHSLAGSDTYG